MSVLPAECSGLCVPYPAEPAFAPYDVFEDVDAYALLDQDQGVVPGPPTGLLALPGELLQQQQQHMQLQLDGNASGPLTDWMSPPCSSPSSSPRQAGQSRQRASNAFGKGGGRKCTSLAQREAHKRYREKKKQSIAAMEVAVQTKRYELEQLLAENEQLKSRARVLETAERCSVEIHELMKLLDGLQAVALMNPESTEKGSSSCTSRLPQGTDSTAAAASAQAGAVRTSSNCVSSMGSLHDQGQATAPAAGVSTTPASASAFSSSFLQSLMPSAGRHAVGSDPAAAGMVSTQQEPQDQQQLPEAMLISLQNEDHWLQMAQRYLDCPESQQQQEGDQQDDQHAQGQFPASAAAPVQHRESGQGTCSEAEGTEGAAACSMSPSSTAESVSVLAEMGSVDTPEQGLVIYKAFLQKASEMLALAQQQQQQGEMGEAAATENQLSELTRTTIGRLQPFLVARGQGIVYDWNARNLETQRPEEPPHSLWPAVLDALQLTDVTQRDALQCFELFGGPLTRLLEERVRLAQRYRELQQAPPVGVDSSSGSGSDGESIVNIAKAKTLEAVAGPFIASGAVLRALAANLERYQSLDGVFAHSLTTLLTGSQIAAACVASYPYLPRWHAMMSALKQRKEDEAQQQLQALQGYQASQMAQRRSSRVRTATQAAKESYL